MSSSVIEAITGHCNLEGTPHPFMPKLQSLKFAWDGQDGYSASLATILGGSQLLHLTFAVQEEELGVHPIIFGCIMRAFGMRSPQLGTVVLTFLSDPPNLVMENILLLLNPLQNLRTFECRSPLSTDTVQFLARLPYLTTLDVRLSRNLKDTTLTPDPTPDFFPNLQNVHIRAKEVRRGILLLDNIQSRALKKVNLTTSARALTLSDLKRYFRSLGSRKTVQKVIVQKFSGSTGRTFPEDPSTIRADTFAPLLRLRNITILAVSTGFAVDLDDGFIKNIADAWPSLHRISILSERPLPSKPKISLDGIFVIFQKCTSIYTIALTLDPSVPPSKASQEYLFSIRSKQSELGMGLHQISVRNSSLVEDQQSVAVFLHDMFPGCHLAVEDRKTDESEERRRIQSWEEVKVALRRLRQERKARMDLVRAMGEFVSWSPI